MLSQSFAPVARSTERFRSGGVEQGTVWSPDDGEQRILARMRRLHTRVLSYDRIARSLNGSDMPAKRGGIWHAMAFVKSFG
jgi:hypothetical protein